MRNIQTGEGNFVTDQDVQNANRVAVLGPTAATDLFGDPTQGGQDPLGQTIRIRGLAFTVVGVTKTKGGTGFNNPDDQAMIPYTTAMKRITGEKYLRSINVQIGSAERMEVAQHVGPQSFVGRDGLLGGRFRLG